MGRCWVGTLNDSGKVGGMSSPERPVRVVVFTLLPGLLQVVEQYINSRGDKLVGVVTAPGPRTRRSDEYRQVMELARPGLDIVVSNYPNRWAEMIRPIRPDLIFCFGFNWKIPDDVINLPPMGTFNMHDAALPKYRGRNATGWALRTGNPGFGISVHKMTSEFDSGPVMASREITIGDDDDADDLLPKMEKVALEVFIEAYDRVIEGHPGVPQDEAEATYAGGAFEPEWREIDWNNPARDVFFQIRSWSGFRGVPRGAFADLEGQRILILKAKPAGKMVSVNGARPGDLVSRSEHEVIVQCADHPLRVLEWEPA
jgi:methionyl-tRNA formyltransferase